MSQQINYISVSAIDSTSSNYIIKANDIILINGRELEAIHVKVGDIISFTDSSGNPIGISHVASVTHHTYQPTCIGGDCFAYMPNARGVRVNTLRVGDMVLNACGEYVKITHVLKTMVGQEIDMYVRNKKSPAYELKITGYHPVFIEDEGWVYPALSEQFECRREWTAAVYSFAVEGGKPIYVNHIPVATLAHNETGPVIGHDYFGTDAVLRDIERISPDRYAVIQMEQIVRDSQTGNVIGLK